MCEQASLGASTCPSIYSKKKIISKRAGGRALRHSLRSALRASLRSSAVATIPRAGPSKIQITFYFRALAHAKARESAKKTIQTQKTITFSGDF
jgi:hypothetical protein